MGKRLQGMIVGVIIGSMFGGSIVFAKQATETVSRVYNDIKITLNGSQLSPKDVNGNIVEPFTINGTTYLPVRAVGSAMNLDVNWNGTTKTVALSTPKADTSKYSRQNPAPINTVQTYTKNDKYSTNNHTATIKLTEVKRGASVWADIYAQNQFNTPPKEGYEYLLAKVEFSLISAQDDKAINVNYFNFDAYSANNEKYELASVVYDEKLDTTLFAGGTATGYLVFLVKTTDTSPKFVYDLSYDGTGGAWFSLKQ